jgi:hypothetical protein
MSSLQYQALSGRRRRCRRSSPFVSALSLMAVAAPLALVQSAHAEKPAISSDGVWQVDIVHQAVAAAKAK